ncbi:hypothetical protein J4457_01425 [Candidatus Woesearchaeota archaeon]|nr:hypothetical protein [Candidatus Woesearchaeota archaeon]
MAKKQRVKQERVKQEKIRQKIKQESEEPTESSNAKGFFSTVLIFLVAIVLAFVIANVFSYLSSGEFIPLTPQKILTVSGEDRRIVELPTNPKYELTQVDIFNLPEWNSYEVTVNGVKLGDTVEQVEEKLGTPFNVIRHNANALTIEYGVNNASDNTSDITLQFFTINNQVRRIFVRNHFNDFLVGSTKINYNLRGIYDKFGIPDQQEDVYRVRVFEYHDLGLEVYHRRKEMVAFALVPPGLNGGQDEEKGLAEFAGQ